MLIECFYLNLTFGVFVFLKPRLAARPASQPGEQHLAQQNANRNLPPQTSSNTINQQQQ